MSPLDFGVAILVVVPVFPILTSVLLAQHWKTDSVTLHERTIVAVRDAGVAAIVALLALRYLIGWDWPPGLTIALFYVALLMVSVPSTYWLWLYFFGHFEPELRGDAETPLQREDRLVGDTRRELQARDADPEE